MRTIENQNEWGRIVEKAKFHYGMVESVEEE